MQLAEMKIPGFGSIRHSVGVQYAWSEGDAHAFIRRSLLLIVMSFMPL